MCMALYVPEACLFVCVHMYLCICTCWLLISASHIIRNLSLPLCPPLPPSLPLPPPLCRLRCPAVPLSIRRALCWGRTSWRDLTRKVQLVELKPAIKLQTWHVGITFYNNGMWAWDLHIHVASCIHIICTCKITYTYTCICQDGSSILDGGVLQCMCVQLPEGRGTGSSTMPTSKDSCSTLDRYYCHAFSLIHTCTCMYMYMYIINCQLGKTTYCTFTCMCTFLERIKCKEASLEGGGRERGNLQLVIVGRKQCTCTCTCTFREWVGNWV